MTEPFVTIIMAVRNESAFIARSLGAVLNQDYPGNRMEILVADGESTDDTVDVARGLPGSERVRFITNPKRVQSAGLNLLIPMARGDYIVRVDGHTIVEPDYVRQCVNTLLSTSAQVVGGPMRPVGATRMGKAIAAVGRSRFAVPTAFHVSESAGYTDTVYLGAWPRVVLTRTGGFDESLSPNEDYELNYRIRRSGGRIYLSPAISSRYFCRQTLGALARQYMAYGVAKTRTLRKYPSSLRLRQIVAPAFVLFLALGLPLRLLAPGVFPLWLAGLTLYALCVIAFSLATARRSGSLAVDAIALAFVTIHMCWGAGFWLGWVIRAGAQPIVPSSFGDSASAREAAHAHSNRV